MSEASPARGDELGIPPGAPWDESQPELEQRAEPRFTLLIRTAKLVSASGEYLCVVRDVSREGLKVRTFHPLPDGEDFAIELASGERYRIEKVWEDADITGFRFAGAVGLDRLLAEAPDGMRKRPVRLRLALPLTLHSGGRPLQATFVDISQHGACIECPDHLALDERIRLECGCLPDLDARVRWRRRPLYGLIFEQTFRFDELARLTAPHQAPAPAAAQPGLRVLGS
jgi:hypothetical protein